MDRRRGFVGALTGLATVALLAACSSATDASVPELEGEIGTSITDGQLDGPDHPFVGLMVAQAINPETGLYAPLWRCSGTLISPSVFLTAGHCTATPAEHVEIWFDADVESGIPGNGYPFNGQVGGDPYVHPEFYTAPFFVHDVGVVVLDAPMLMAEYGQLPDVDMLDALKTRRGKQDTTFTAVGYGLQQSFPDAVSRKTQADRVRMVATPHLLQINVPGFTGDFSMLLSNNASTGGTCFGDSGGPNFLGDSNVVAGVTSFGINGNCAGTGGVFRMDRQNVLDFVNTFLLPQ
ncbi:MAG: trypsin-like serine protease [Trueperaceae bacterium]|nr:trypsin-like serine protease [Trueperaceae bacterium]